MHAINKSVALLLFALMGISSANAGSCYRADSVAGKIEGLDQDASLTFVQSERPEFSNHLVIRNTKAPFKEIIKVTDCNSKARICYIGDGIPVQLIYEGSKLKLETNGPIAIKYGDGKNPKPFLTVNSSTQKRVIDNMNILYGIECDRLVAALPFNRVFPDEEPPVHGPSSPVINADPDSAGAQPEMQMHQKP